MMRRFIAWIRVCWRGLGTDPFKAIPPYRNRKDHEDEPVVLRGSGVIGSSPRPGVSLSDVMTEKLKK